MQTERFDVVVVGGGPAGYAATIRLAQLGLRALCVERERVGGVCLNWGCIPTKALISAAAGWERIHSGAAMGISVDGARFDLARTQAWKDDIVERLTGGVEGLIRSNGAELRAGTARLLAPDRVEIRRPDGSLRVVVAERAVVVATGAAPVRVPGLEPDGGRVLGAREAVALAELPGRLVVVGGGVIGMELGMMYQRLGSRVVVVEAADGILSGLDRDLVRVVEQRFRARGGEVLASARVVGWEEAGAFARVRVEGDRVDLLEADRVLVAVGFRPNSAGLGLERIGVELDGGGHVRVDDQYRTRVPTVFAVGDVTGAPYLAHKAYREAELAAEVIAGRAVRRDWRAMPAAVFTDPEIATVGMGEAEARAAGFDVRVGRFPFSVLGRSLSLGDPAGFVKVVADHDRILGVGIVGAEASELIAEAAFAIEMMASPEDLGLTVHAHPTLAEALHEAARHAVGEAIHIHNRPARAPRAAGPAVAGA